jgi:hypothetical protein
LPCVYRLFRTIVLGDGCGVYLSEYVRPVPGFADSLYPRDFAVRQRGVIPFRLTSIPPLGDAVNFSYDSL